MVDVLEKRGQGLNLTWEVRDGIINHSITKMPHTVEGQVVRIADKMAYIHHDIDDAIRGGVLRESDLPEECTDILGHTVKGRLNVMIRDAIRNSLGQDHISLTAEVEGAMMELRQYMFENVYIGSAAKAEEGKAEQVVERLVDHFRTYPEELPAEYARRMLTGDSEETVICDYVSGMSDNYAIRTYERLFVPRGWDVY